MEIIMINELHVFDFDGTLFKSPKNTPDNQRLYESVTGLPWTISKEKSLELSKKYGRPIKMRRGWWSRPETLQPPIVPDPVTIEWFNPKVVEAFQLSKANPNSLTCLITGRHFALKKQVMRICQDINLFEDNDEVSSFFLGDDGPLPHGEKPAETLEWKLWIIRQIINSNSNLRKIIFWEDREEHVQPFLNLNGENSIREVIVHRIYSN